MKPTSDPISYHDEVQAALAGLGSTVTAIAETLAAKGIRGRRRSRVHCPLAQYLRAQFPDLAVQVSSESVHVHRRPVVVGWELTVERVELPPAATAFVAAYDDEASRLFPELDVVSSP